MNVVARCKNEKLVLYKLHVNQVGITRSTCASPSLVIAPMRERCDQFLPKQSTARNSVDAKLKVCRLRRLVSFHAEKSKLNFQLQLASCLTVGKKNVAMSSVFHS
ncbi:hypothetical protein T4B_8742 [Trichinella pseudospiralis]|uniref:Uncharacterized protein n=1 Tax=Trichinella pseudospiralis TaxID=6337 RepID=A0A0V1IRC5_TRIPS|nr:hypothetical protein T4B_8742 [Trichinella pseudospiralis]